MKQVGQLVSRQQLRPFVYSVEGMPQGLRQWNPHISSTCILVLAKLHSIVKVWSTPSPGWVGVVVPHGQKEGVGFMRRTQGVHAQKWNVLEDLRVGVPTYSHRLVFLLLPSPSQSYGEWSSFVWNVLRHVIGLCLSALQFLFRIKNKLPSTFSAAPFWYLTTECHHFLFVDARQLPTLLRC